MNPIIERYNCRLLAVVSLGAGIAGMLACSTLLVFAPIHEATVAGMPFVAGAVLFVGGIFCLTVQSYKTANEEHKN